MESYEFDAAPPSRVTASATYAQLKAHPELYYDGADIGFMILAAALVLLMIPGISLLYSGASDRHSTFTLARLPLITTAFVGCQWYLWGYTLTFSPAASPSTGNVSASWYGGDTRANAFMDIWARPVGIGRQDFGKMTGPKIPEMVYVLYQGMFAAFTASIVCGAVWRKTYVGRFIVFIILWTTLVYDPVARWTWHPQGWSRIRGVMDFAGGTAVHVCSGATVAAYCIFFQLEVRGWSFTFWRKPQQPRSSSQVDHQPEGFPLRTLNNDSSHRTVDGDTRTCDTEHNSDSSSSATSQRETQIQELEAAAEDQANCQELELAFDLEKQHTSPLEAPYNPGNVVLGTALLWIGWFGFNGGSALGINLRAASACLSTHIAACAGGSVSLLLEWSFAAMYEYASDKGYRSDHSVIAFCDGVIAGLVAITPGAGYVPVKVASIFGVVAALVCTLLKKLVNKHVLRYDLLHICAVHAGAGFIGMLFTAFFASDAVTGLDGYSKLDDSTLGERVRDQLLDVSAGFFYSFTVTFLILCGLKVLRAIFNSGRLTPARRAMVTKDKIVALPQYVSAQISE